MRLWHDRCVCWCVRLIVRWKGICWTLSLHSFLPSHLKLDAEEARQTKKKPTTKNRPYCSGIPPLRLHLEVRSEEWNSRRSVIGQTLQLGKKDSSSVVFFPQQSFEVIQFTQKKRSWSETSLKSQVTSFYQHIQHTVTRNSKLVNVQLQSSTDLLDFILIA